MKVILLTVLLHAEQPILLEEHDSIASCGARTEEIRGYLARTYRDNSAVRAKLDDVKFACTERKELPSYQ